MRVQLTAHEEAAWRELTRWRQARGRHWPIPATAPSHPEGPRTCVKVPGSAGFRSSTASLASTLEARATKSARHRNGKLKIPGCSDVKDVVLFLLSALVQGSTIGTNQNVFAHDSDSLAGRRCREIYRQIGKSENSHQRNQAFLRHEFSTVIVRCVVAQDGLDKFHLKTRKLALSIDISGLETLPQIFIPSFVS